MPAVLADGGCSPRADGTGSRLLTQQNIGAADGGVGSMQNLD